eukprot:2903907-Alexandrium_andersonii.AAC.1
MRRRGFSPGPGDRASRPGRRPTVLQRQSYQCSLHRTTGQTEMPLLTTSNPSSKRASQILRSSRSSHSISTARLMQ